MADKTSTIPFSSPIVASLRLAMAAFVLLLAGCVNPPVQEMSDARQAVEAAIHAGASNAAPDKMASAQTELKLAERLLRDHQFNAARHYARNARAKAMEAQAIAQSKSDASRTQP